VKFKKTAPNSKLMEAKIAEGAWCCDGEPQDISYKWVTKMEDIQLIE